MARTGSQSRLSDSLYQVVTRNLTKAELYKNSNSEGVIQLFADNSEVFTLAITKSAGLYIAYRSADGKTTSNML